METEWYVIDARTDTIINCITTQGAKPTLDPKRWVSAEHLRLDRFPTFTQLQDYEFWSKRP